MISKDRFSLWSKFKASFRLRRDLDSLLQSTPAEDSNLKDRIQWTEDLLQWIRSRGYSKHEFDFQSGTPQAARLRYLLLVLDRNPEWKLSAGKLLRSVIRDTRAMDLFTEIGLSSRDSFWAEFFGRLNEKLLPQPPKIHELSTLLHQNFRTQADVEWMRAVDTKTFSRVMELFQTDGPVDFTWHQVQEDLRLALLLLSHQVKGLGLSALIRKRLERFDFRDLPFYQLPSVVEEYLKETDKDMRLVLSDKIEKKVVESFQTLNEVHQHMDEYGVSVQIVYQIERMELMLNRIRNLNILLSAPMNAHLLSSFLEILVAQNRERHSLTGLLSENFSLLSRKIAERTAETGEHYITRTVNEYFDMIRKSFGGGFVTTFTTLIKFLVYHVGLSDFFTGVAASINYSVSFLVLHFAHFTLGTKQPAMTAPALAEKMHGIRDPIALQGLVDEIIDLIRSQIAAVFGNVIGVFPFTVAFGLLWEWVFRRTLLDPNKAHHVLESFSILGPTPIYAAFTGVLLWASSIFSGWMDNWFAYHQLGTALSHNRRLNFIFGEKGARALALFAKKNMAGVSASISLGFLLGLSPSVLQFFGIPLDVRHVTLSSGAIGAAMVCFTAENFPVRAFWLAVLGVISMGIFNILVSFSLALFVAIRARRIQAPERGLIYRAVLHRLRERPLSLFWPSKDH